MDRAITRWSLRVFAVAGAAAAVAASGAATVLSGVPLASFELVPPVPGQGFDATVATVPLGAVATAVAASTLLARARRGISRTRAIGFGVLTGAIASLAPALVETVAGAMTVEYIRGPYRAYAFAYLAVAMGALAFAAARALRGRDQELAALVGAPFAAVVLAAAGVALSRAVPVFAAASAAAALGTAIALCAPERALQRTKVALTSPLTLAALIIAATFVTRLGFGLNVLTTHGPGLPFAVASDDGDAYYKYARALIEEPAGSIPIVLANGVYAPGYSFVLALMLLIDGGSFLTVIGVHAAMAALAAYLTVRVATHLAGTAAGLTAGGLFVVQQNLIHIQSTLTTEALLLPLLAGATLALLRYARGRQLRWVVIAGVCFAFAVFTRNVVAILALSSAVWLATRYGRTGVLHGLLLLAIAATAVLPATLASARVHGTAQLTNQTAAISWEYTSGNWERAAPSNVRLVDRGLHPVRDPLGTLTRAIGDPGPLLGFYAEVVPRRIATLLFRPNHGAFEPLTILNGAVVPSVYFEIVSAFLIVGLLAGAFVLLRPGRARRGDALVVVLGVLAYILLFSLFFAPLHPVRYRVPIDPYLIAIQAAGLVWCASRLRYALRAEA